MAAPVWSINKVNMNLFVADTPLWYKNPIGPSVGISVSYNSQSDIVSNAPFGNKWQFSYSSYLSDEGGQVVIYMPDGRRDVYSTDGSGGYSHPYQVFNTLTKIAANHFELRFPDDTVYVYNVASGSTSYLSEIRDAHGQKLTFVYDSSSRLTTIADALGRVTTLIYNAGGLVTRVTDPFDRSADFEYDANRNLTKITDMGGYWSSFTYSNDSNSYLASITDSKGTWNFYIEPSDNNIDASSEYPPPGGTMGYNYRITITDPSGGKEEYYYNSYKGYGWYISPKDYINYSGADNNNSSSSVPKILYNYTTTSGQRGEISQTIYPEGGFTGGGYDATGNNTSISDSYGHTTHYTYNNVGRVTSTTDAKGITTNMTYADNGVDLLLTQNGLGTIAMTYNSSHDVTSITDRLGNATTFTYNGYGQITSQTDALGIVTNYIYDAGHNLQQVVRDGKTLESFSYDLLGRVKTRTNASGLTLTYDYDNLDEIVKVTYPDGKFITYTYSNQCPRLIDSMTDRSGRTDSYTYDALKRLTETRNPGGGIIKDIYDADSNIIKFTDPNGNATKFNYDRDGRLVKKTYADGKSVTFYYDRAGLLTSRINARGITTSYTYDQNQNLLSIVYSDGTPGVKYQYDDYNRGTQRQDGTGIYQYTYDANSRLVSVDGPWADDTVTYQYDSLGRRTGLLLQGGQAVAYTYDSLGRLTGIQAGTNAYSYTYSNANPLVQNLTRPNGSVTDYSYDALNRLIGISNKNSAAAIINEYVYAYNQQDVRSSETITNDNPITTFQNELITYSYNKVNQLLSSTNPDKNFTYDNDGNMTRGYTPEGYVFAAAYDAEDRLKSLEYTNGSGVVHKTEYIYSGDNLLAEMKKYENGVLVSDTQFVRDGFLVLQERNGGNNVVREYIWGLDMGGGIGGLLNLKQGGQDYLYLYDGKGNVTALIDSSQNVAATYTYDTFGNLMSKTGTLNQPFQFSTKKYDEKTGLSYYGYRFYSPVLGRWITRDPLGETGGINLYEFVGGNSVNSIDPLGNDVGDWLIRYSSCIQRCKDYFKWDEVCAVSTSASICRLKITKGLGAKVSSKVAALTVGYCAGIAIGCESACLGDTNIY
jgi:RHS repeat-associated protein